MIRSVASVVLASSLAVVSTACGSAADERGESTAQEIVTRCTTPFSVLNTSSGGDQGDGVRPTRPIVTCDVLASPPLPPPYADADTITSCAQASRQSPPASLSACTWGYRIYSLRGYQEVFLCPIGMTVPASSFTPADGDGGRATSDYYRPIAHLANGCFGDSLDPSYGFVGHTVVYEDLNPGNCGAKCGHF